MLYDQLVFSRQNLAYQDHSVRIISDSTPNPDKSLYVNFDYAIYTVPDEPPTDTETPSMTTDTSSTVVSSPTPLTNEGSISSTTLTFSTSRSSSSSRLPQTSSGLTYTSSQSRSSFYMSPTSSDAPEVTTESASSSRSAEIAGGTVGGLVGMILLCVSMYYAARYIRTRSTQSSSNTKDRTIPTPFKDGELPLGAWTDDTAMEAASYAPAMRGATRKGHRQRQRQDRLQRQIEQLERELRELNERASMYTTRRQRTRSIQGQDKTE